MKKLIPLILILFISHALAWNPPRPQEQGHRFTLWYVYYQEKLTGYECAPDTFRHLMWSLQGGLDPRHDYYWISNCGQGSICERDTIPNFMGFLFTQDTTWDSLGRIEATYRIVKVDSIGWCCYGADCN